MGEREAGRVVGMIPEKVRSVRSMRRKMLKMLRVKIIIHHQSKRHKVVMQWMLNLKMIPNLFLNGLKHRLHFLDICTLCRQIGSVSVPRAQRGFIFTTQKRASLSLMSQCNLVTWVLGHSLPAFIGSCVSQKIWIKRGLHQVPE